MGSNSERLVEVIAAWTGIDLERGGRATAVDRFIESRTRALDMTAEAYVRALSAPGHPEIMELVQAITIGHTWFYRDAEQLELISNVARTELGKNRRTVHIWIPGCATGEDVYTLAMLAERDGWNASLLGTDINPRFVDHARIGRYAEWSLRDLPPELRDDFRHCEDGRLEVAARLRAKVNFRQHNLLDRPPGPPFGAWHVILCRNVLIYFRSPRATIEKLGGALAPDGWLFLGATDAIKDPPSNLSHVSVAGRSAFHRASPAARRKSRAPRTRVTGRPASPLSARPARSEIAPRARPPESHDSLFAAGVAALEGGDLVEALDLLIKALELDPLSAETHLFAGIAYHLASDSSAAVQTLRAALLLEPDLWVASFYLALSYERLGLANAAKREFAIVARALENPERSAREVRLSDKLRAWEKDIADLAQRRSR